MLTLYDFIGMDENVKGGVIFGEGTFVDDRLENGLNVQLYSLNDFYVEVYYDPVANEINRFRGFKSLGQLAPYIDLS